MNWKNNKIDQRCIYFYILSKYLGSRKKFKPNCAKIKSRPLQKKNISLKIY